MSVSMPVQRSRRRAAVEVRRARRSGPSAGEAENEGTHARACGLWEVAARVTTDDLDDLADCIDDVTLGDLQCAQVLRRDGRPVCGAFAVGLQGGDEIAQDEDLRVDLCGRVLRRSGTSGCQSS